MAVIVLLGMSMLGRPERSVFVATRGWTVIIIVFGGDSVLPLSILPFVPKQTIGHYVTHVVYALTQVPLLWVAWRGVRSYRRSDLSATYSKLFSRRLYCPRSRTRSTMHGNTSESEDGRSGP